MSSFSGKRVRSRRRVILSWIPTTLVALVCIGFVVGAIAVQNSWWADPNPTAGPGQESARGMSLFDSAGVDFFTRKGVVKVEVRPESEAATELGMDADGQRTVEPIVPVRVIVLTTQEAFSIELVTSMTIETAEDRVVAVDVDQDGNGRWADVYPLFTRTALSWGWSQEQLDALLDELTAASQSGSAYSAELPPIESRGLLVSAKVDVDTGASSTRVSYRLTEPDSR